MTIHTIIQALLSPAGLIVLAALDSSIVFFVPLSIDIAVVIVAARYHDMFWMPAILATGGSIVGASITYWIGRKLGSEGLERFADHDRLASIEARVRVKGAYALGAAALIPPPFPYTLLVLSSGALAVDRRKLFGTMAGVRFLRFGGETVLALIYGPQIIRWLESGPAKVGVEVMIGIMIAGTIVSAIRLWLVSRRERGRGSDG